MIEIPEDKADELLSMYLNRNAAIAERGIARVRIGRLDSLPSPPPRFPFPPPPNGTRHPAWLLKIAVSVAVLLVAFNIVVFFVKPDLTHDQRGILQFLSALLCGAAVAFLGGDIGLRFGGVKRSAALAATGGVALFVLTYLYPPYWYAPNAEDQGRQLEITYPQNGTAAKDVATVTGVAHGIPKNEALYLVVFSHTDHFYYPKTRVLPGINGEWTAPEVSVGAKDDKPGSLFEIEVVLADKLAQTEFEDYFNKPERDGLRVLPPTVTIAKSVTVSRQ